MPSASVFVKEAIGILGSNKVVISGFRNETSLQDVRATLLSLIYQFFHCVSRKAATTIATKLDIMSV